MPERLEITIRVGGHTHTFVKDDFDVNDLHPARRGAVLRMVEADLSLLAKKLGVHDEFAEMMRELKRNMTLQDFAAYTDALDPDLRARLMRCGVIGPLDGPPLS